MLALGMSWNDQTAGADSWQTCGTFVSGVTGQC